MPRETSPSSLHVFIMEPHGGGGLSRARNYLCPTSTEGIDAAEGRIYWVVCSTAAFSLLKGRETILDSASGFGLEVAPASPEEAVRDEFDHRYLDPRVHRTWFEVRGGGEDLGYHFAALVYSAYRLKSLARTKLVSMHLVGQLEGNPYVLKGWHRRD